MTDTATIVGHICLFLTTVIGFLLQWFREERKHRWDKEQYRILNGNIKNSGESGK
jgi:hypothetical protein